MSDHDPHRAPRHQRAGSAGCASGPQSAASPEPATGDGWRAMLREERMRLRLTQGQLAAAAHLSEESIRKYELGTRSPSREALFRIIEALQVPQVRARDIVTDAGFAPAERLFPLAANPGYYFTQAEAAAYVETVPWPRFVVNNVMEVVAANQAARLLWDVDLETELAQRSRPELHFLALMVEPRFAGRIANFDECLATVVSVLKGVPQGGGALDHPGPWVQSVLAQLSVADPDSVARLLRAWDSAKPAEPKVHFRYEITWREPQGDIRFAGVISAASEPDGLAFSDWIPWSTVRRRSVCHPRAWPPTNGTRAMSVSSPLSRAPTGTRSTWEGSPRSSIRRARVGRALTLSTPDRAIRSGPYRPVALSEGVPDTRLCRRSGERMQEDGTAPIGPRLPLAPHPRDHSEWPGRRRRGMEPARPRGAEVSSSLRRIGRKGDVRTVSNSSGVVPATDDRRRLPAHPGGGSNTMRIVRLGCLMTCLAAAVVACGSNTSTAAPSSSDGASEGARFGAVAVQVSNGTNSNGMPALIVQFGLRNDSPQLRLAPSVTPRLDIAEGRSYTTADYPFHGSAHSATPVPPGLTICGDGGGPFDALFYDVPAAGHPSDVVWLQNPLSQNNVSNLLPSTDMATIVPCGAPNVAGLSGNADFTLALKSLAIADEYPQGQVTVANTSTLDPLPLAGRIWALTDMGYAVRSICPDNGDQTVGPGQTTDVPICFQKASDGDVEQGKKFPLGSAVAIMAVAADGTFAVTLVGSSPASQTPPKTPTPITPTPATATPAPAEATTPGSTSAGDRVQVGSVTMTQPWQAEVVLKYTFTGIPAPAEPVAADVKCWDPSEPAVANNPGLIRIGSDLQTIVKLANHGSATVTLHSLDCDMYYQDGSAPFFRTTVPVNITLSPF